MLDRADHETLAVLAGKPVQRDDGIHHSLGWLFVKHVDVTSLPESIGFVFCDGPPGTTRGGRIGMMPVLKDRLAPGAVVLFDDTSRPGEREVVELCCAELRADLVEDAPGHSAIRVPA